MSCTPHDVQFPFITKYVVKFNVSVKLLKSSKKIALVVGKTCFRIKKVNDWKIRLDSRHEQNEDKVIIEI